jgi:hypothetical protein
VAVLQDLTGAQARKNDPRLFRGSSVTRLSIEGTVVLLNGGVTWLPSTGTSTGRCRFYDSDHLLSVVRSMYRNRRAASCDVPHL